MRKIFVLSIICISALFALSASQAHAECYNEDTCYKDYVTEKGNDIVVAVNRDTAAVELYWSDKDNNWLKPDKEYQATLQKRYNKKLQLRDMQKRLNQMNSSTMFTTNEGSGSHGR